QLVPRADVVVDDVEEDGEPAAVAGGHETPQRGWAPVGLVHRPQADAVVSPAVVAGEGGDRHQLNDGDAERRQVIKAADGGFERPLRGEGAGVQFVDHRAADGHTAPAAVGPGEGAVVVGPAGAVRP